MSEPYLVEAWMRQHLEEILLPYEVVQVNTGKQIEEIIRAFAQDNPQNAEDLKKKIPEEAGEKEIEVIRKRLYASTTEWMMDEYYQRNGRRKHPALLVFNEDNRDA